MKARNRRRWRAALEDTMICAIGTIAPAASRAKGCCLNGRRHLPDPARNETIFYKVPAST